MLRDVLELGEGQLHWSQVKRSIDDKREGCKLAESLSWDSWTSFCRGWSQGFSLSAFWMLEALQKWHSHFPNIHCGDKSVGPDVFAIFRRVAGKQRTWGLQNTLLSVDFDCARYETTSHSTPSCSYFIALSLKQKQPFREYWFCAGYFICISLNPNQLGSCFIHPCFAQGG